MNIPLEDFQGVSRELNRFDIPSWYRLPTLDEWKEIFEGINEIPDYDTRREKMKEIRQKYDFTHWNYYWTSTSRWDKENEIYWIELAPAGWRMRQFYSNCNTGRVRLIPIWPILFI